jgi:hypothetical protein
MKKIQKKKTLRRIAFLSLSVVVFSNADENDSPRKLFLSLSLSLKIQRKRETTEKRCAQQQQQQQQQQKTLSLVSLVSLSRLFFETNLMNARRR